MLTFLFVIWLIISAFMQAEDHPAKKIVSPMLTAFCGLLLLIGAWQENVPFQTGAVLFVALILLAASDFMFERSNESPGLFTVAMVLGVLSGFTIGILINVSAISENIPLAVQGELLGASILVTLLIYRYLQVEPGLKIPVFIYLIQAVILLTGGLSSLYLGDYHFAVWGVFIFISDSLVGLRAFPNPQRPISWLNHRRILFLIIVLYYAAQYALVSWAL